jgi:hypothetical protein
VAEVEALEADASEAELPVAEVPVADTAVAEAPEVEAPETDGNADAPGPDDVPSSVADPVSDRTAGADDTADGPRDVR